jgi:DNA-binding transcriptional ArsR family regulator
VVGHPVRLQLLEALAGGPQSVSELARLIGAEHQSISKHLSELLRVNVVVRRQDGNFAFYSLPDALTLRAVGLVCRSVTEDRVRLADLAAELEDRSSPVGTRSHGRPRPFPGSPSSAQQLPESREDGPTPAHGT